MNNLLNIQKLFEHIQISLEKRISSEHSDKNKEHYKNFKKKITKLESDLKLLIMIYIAKENLNQNFNQPKEINNILDAVKKSFLSENHDVFDIGLIDIKKDINLILQTIYDKVLSHKNTISLQYIKMITATIFSIDNDLLNKNNILISKLTKEFNIDFFYTEFIKLKDELLKKYNYKVAFKINENIDKLHEYFTYYNYVETSSNFYVETIKKFKIEINEIIKNHEIERKYPNIYNNLIDKLKTFFIKINLIHDQYNNYYDKNKEINDKIIEFMNNNINTLLENLNENNELISFSNELASVLENYVNYFKNPYFHPNVFLFLEVILASIKKFNSNIFEEEPTLVEAELNICLSKNKDCFYKKFLLGGEKNKTLIDAINQLDNNQGSFLLRIDDNLLKQTNVINQNIIYLMYEIFDKYFPNYEVLSSKYLYDVVLPEFYKKLKNIENFTKDYNFYKNLEKTKVELNKEILDKKIYGMDNVKSPLLKNIKIAKYNKSGFKISPTLLVGEPGTGKSYLLKTIAENLNIPYLFLSCNGKEDWTLLGLNASWKNAKQSEITAFLDKNNNPKNALIILDEIDKHSRSNQSNFPVALSLLLDENLNHHFIDAFNLKEYDLSGITFLMTSNDLNLNGKGFGDNVFPDYLLSRMTILNVQSYSFDEKIFIIKNIMINKIFDEFNYQDNHEFIFSDEILNYIIKKTNEGGLRQIEKIMKTIYKEYIYLKEEGLFNCIDFTFVKNVLKEMDIDNNKKIKVGFNY